MTTSPRRRDTLADDLAQLVRGYRLRTGSSQNALARIAGMDPAYVNRIEHGRDRAPSRDVILKLAAALDLSPCERDELLVVVGHCPESLRELSPSRRRRLLARLDELAQRRADRAV